MKRYGIYVDGAYADPANAKWFESDDPYVGAPWAEIPQCGEADVDRAVKAAKRAMTVGPWKAMAGSRRGMILRRIGDLIAANAERLAELEVRDNGKLYAEMLSQVKFNSEWWWYYAGLADKIEGTLVPVENKSLLAMTKQYPVGVVACITAFNSPLLFLALKCAPAIAAGCAVVVKPSEFTSASTLEFAALAEEAGLPAGMFNVVTGFGPEVGQALVAHPDVAKVSFTGSDFTGRRIYAAAAQTMKRVSLELGGKSPNIVFADCDMDAAVAGAISGVFAATGQTCIAGSRLLVQNGIYDEFLDRLRTVAATAKIGNPMLAETNIGPVATAPQYKKILDYIDIAKSEGAQCVLGGRAASVAGSTSTQFVEPTIFANVNNEMRIAREEVFGPVVSVIPFSDEQNAIEIANDSVYGLAAGVWTKDIGRAIRMSDELNAGTVWVNTYRAISCQMPFGGMKYSGIGRENGISAMTEFLETKAIWISAADSTPPNPFVMRLT